MATLVLETGAGLTNSNSYCDLAGGNTYHDNRLHVTDWTNASDADKETALVWATNLLDDMIAWNGTIANDDQALRWPRDGIIDLDGNTVDDDIIPDFLRESTAEFSRLLIASDRFADSDTAGFKELKVGPIELVMDKYSASPKLPVSVWYMLKSYGSLNNGSNRELMRA